MFGFAKEGASHRDFVSVNLRSRKPTTIVVIGAVIALAVLAWQSLAPSQPSYQGRSLSAWADQYGSNFWQVNGKVGAEEARSAIRQIGADGIPFLLRWIRVEDSVLKTKLRSKLSTTWSQRLGLDDSGGRIRRTGAHGLAALSANASGAIPELIEVATHHPDEDGRYIAVFALRTLGPAAEPAIPFLIGCLTNSVRIIRDDAALGLAAIGRQPEVCVPALCRYLKFVGSSSGWEVKDAIAAVARFGTNARPAVPLLLELLNHSDLDIRQEVTNRLVHIAPDLIGDIGYSQETAIQNALMIVKAGAHSHLDFDLHRNIEVLGWFGTNSQAAVPVLANLVTHADPRVRIAVTNWLPRISAEAAKKVGMAIESRR